MSAVEKRLTTGLRMLREDLLSSEAHPLPPSVWLRWLPHGLVFLIALGITLGNIDQMEDRYHLGAEYTLLCSLAQGAAVALALWWPVPAWWASMVVTVVVALGVRIQLFHLLTGAAQFDLTVPNDLPRGNVPWPWSPPGMIAHAVILFLLALRLPTRVAVEVLALTALATYVVQGVIGAPAYSSTSTLAMALFIGVVLLGSTMRGRREARTQLVEQAGLTAEERARRTVLEERSRIARELHDVVAHHMSVISIQAQVAPHLVENPPDELKENLNGIRQNALEALTELRRVLGVLRAEDPADPDDPHGITAAAEGTAPHTPQPTLDRLDALVENTRAAGLAVTTEIHGDVRPLPPGVELSAYRIVQEALSNALRHAPGSTVRVELTHFPRGLQLRVINSRPDRPAQPSPGAGHGLLGMRERAAMLGGTLMATETSHGGFAVVAFLPRNGAPGADMSPRTTSGTSPATAGLSPDTTGEETP
ncbi:sensor histidine kinase [Streptomyces ipomoeae]|uniref:histidine kinase n=1 Tax=Streptomyces ipomoeae TaxID=103232 RepID=A0AAE8VV96_9ACTN|nr:sensor histidine kinase [Streptomyces ipomoeae]MDX2699854.1 sensor histidine kinase [Streptomyces ipomoeae]MDX2827388.1 sensor histidine kinase [Streptomyces ipomoeae]MDX2845509.1 sensor histidine kinase [Streptomyces ipomoeae]MDX2879897.1 sensor histidine kinase [Streptomyces ipomoeae]TQE16056.1 sensor histidine kinase [Streptomyces ipomoeae]